MTQLQGSIAETPTVMLRNARLSPMLSGYQTDYWPTHQADAGLSISQTAANALPVTTTPRVLSAALAGCYRNDYYERVHVLPRILSMGNLVTVQHRTVAVWNAYTGTAQTLDSVGQANASGINVTAPGALPMTFPPLKYAEWDITVTPDGDPIIDATLTWQFTGLTALAVSVNGNRITPWTLGPDWASPVTERLAWLTNVLPSVTRVEQARALRPYPRRTWEFHCMATGRARQWAEASLYAWSARTWAVPVWVDGQVLTQAANQAQRIDCKTAGRDFAAGQLVMLATDELTYELAEVQAVDATGVDLTRPLNGNWGRGTRLYPVRSAWMDSPPTVQRTPSAMRVSPSFTNDDSDWTADDGGVTYRALPVLEQQPETSAASPASSDRADVKNDNTTATPHVIDYTDIGYSSNAHRFWLRGQAQRTAWRSLMYYLRGRYKLLWVPTYQLDVTLAADILANADSLTIGWMGYTRMLAGRQHRRDIRIELVDGTVWYRRVTGWQELDATTERLTLDSTLPTAATAAQVRMISFMALCRLDADMVEIAHRNGLGDTEGVAVSTLTFKAVNDDV